MPSRYRAYLALLALALSAIDARAQSQAELRWGGDAEGGELTLGHGLERAR